MAVYVIAQLSMSSPVVQVVDRLEAQLVLKLKAIVSLASIDTLRKGQHHCFCG